MLSTDVDTSDWLNLIRAEYFEIPGLSLTRQQAQRLWALDTATCKELLAQLVADHFLRQTAADTYVRADRDW
jgi:hypothetical protein